MFFNQCNICNERWEAGTASTCKCPPLPDYRFNMKDALNAELLEALKLADALLWGANMNAVVVERKVKAAIAKAEGEQA